ncbi:MAG: hypothetical protein EOO85_17625 [Pedobacter sp.]|nr:MAG: hypothetical protein EOO85_17625 [Pedobacter sp.]
MKCGKRKPYSTWKVNGIEYSSNNVEAVVGKAVAILASHEYNRFDISFSGNYLPQSGNWPIRKLHANLQSPDSVTIYFYEGTKIFKPSFNESTRLRAVEYNGKSQVTLPPTWFVDYYNDTDSVLIEGTFNEP